MRILIIGFGRVAAKACEILHEAKADPSALLFDANLARLARKLTLSGLSTYTRGSSVFSDDSPESLEPSFLESTLNQHGSGSEELVETLDYDVLVELSTLNALKEGRPARTYIETALKRKKHVVTANKGPVAFAYKELLQLAKDNGVLFLCESAVMDGAPVFNLKRSCLLGARILGLEGLLNSTSTFVIDKMVEDELSLEEAIAEAQALGITEADPSFDLQGMDSACKIAALANVFMTDSKGACPSPNDIISSCPMIDISRTSLQSVLGKDVQSSSNGASVRMVSSAWRKADDQIEASVGLQKFETSSIFGSVGGTGAVLTIHTDLMAPISVVQHAPTLSDTAFGVLADLMHIDHKECMQQHKL